MKIGLMMVIRNEINRIKACLDWHVPHFNEVVICDQQSDDGTWEFLLDYFKTKDNVTLVQDKKWGHCSPSRAYAVEQMMADWVVNVDADEIFDLRFLTAMQDLAVGKYDGYWLKRENSFDVQVYDDSIAVQPHWLNVKHPVIEKQFRFYKRRLAKFENRLHSRARVEVKGVENISVLDYLIHHRKTLTEMQDDLARFKGIK
jgi:glycosyltransferase involved in cell wall biosynthesis